MKKPIIIYPTGTFFLFLCRKFKDKLFAGIELKETPISGGNFIEVTILLRDNEAKEFLRKYWEKHK